METRIENWNGYDIRFVNLDGDWYAVLKDICDVLGLRTDKVATRIPPECMERIAVTSDPLSRVDRYELDRVKTITRQMIGQDIGRRPGQNLTRHMLVINESGIYEALFASRKLEARKFRQWTAGVLGTKKTRPHGFRLEKKEKPVEEPELSAKEAIDRAVCDCDTCAHQDICRFECQFRGMTKEMYKHCIEETARYNIPELGLQMRPLHCKRYEPSPAIEELNTAVFHLKAQHLTDELVRKIFGEEYKANE